VETRVCFPPPLSAFWKRNPPSFPVLEIERAFPPPRRREDDRRVHFFSPPFPSPCDVGRRCRGDPATKHIASPSFFFYQSLVGSVNCLFIPLPFFSPPLCRVKRLGFPFFSPSCARRPKRWRRFPLLSLPLSPIPAETIIVPSFFPFSLLFSFPLFGFEVQRRQFAFLLLRCRGLNPFFLLPSLYHTHRG